MPRITCPGCDEVVTVAASSRSVRCPACRYKLIDDDANKRDEEEDEEEDYEEVFLLAYHANGIQDDEEDDYEDDE